MGITADPKLTARQYAWDAAHPDAAEARDFEDLHEPCNS